MILTSKTFQKACKSLLGELTKRIVIFSFFILISCKATDVSIVEIDSHDIQLNIRVADHHADLSDSGIMKVNQGWNLFYMNGTVTVQSLEINGSPAEYQSFLSSDSLSIPSHFWSKISTIDHAVPVQIIVFQSTTAGTDQYSISYSGQFYENVEDVQFSKENVGREVTATISDRGAYFSSSATYYPTGEESMASFKLTADIPENWESISDGNRLSNETRNGRKIQSWENPFKSDGNMFMAAPFVTRSTWVDSVEVACYFFPEDTSLFDSYLPATARYIQMYSELIGPYPYERFTVVENFFPTGYGMPAWTLLGQQVIRLPFIVYTSLGHEVLHNWWGNSVYVDYERGNWCESATVYGADYRYKLMRSEDDARNYRKDILKQYDSYISEENDFPIREFKSRTSPGTRTIGYNKAMMVYHMIEEEIGTKPFFKAWREINSRYQGEKISWEEWITAFEDLSGRSLEHIIPQWLNRPGVPILGVELLAVTKSQGNCQVEFRLNEKSGQGYRLQVPLRFSGSEGVLDTAVVLDKTEEEFTMSVSTDMTTLEIDPDYHLFRRLYPEEIEPIISAVLGGSSKKFITNVEGEEALSKFVEFGSNMTEEQITVVSNSDLAGGDYSYVPVLLNPSELPEYLQEMLVWQDDSVELLGQEYPQEGRTFILTAKDWMGFSKVMVILTQDYDSLPRIGELIPHYGKYSYLIFEGARNVGKGQWSAGESPLRVSFLEKKLSIGESIN